MEWIYGLDILRLFAISLILAYHFFINKFSGGFIAVELFFVFSGFLTMSKIARDYLITGQVRFLHNVRRRFVGLFLPLVLCVIFSLALGFFVDKEILVGARMRSLAALGFFTNILEIKNGGSYEESVLPNIFEHTWFLSLLMQAYLILLVAAKLFFTNKGNRKKELRAFGFTLAGCALVSACLMACYGGLFEYHDRAYFSPDTHIFSFLVGAVVACANLIRPRNKRTSKKGAVLLLLTLATSVSFLSIKLDYKGADAFLWGMQLTALMGALMLYCLIRLQRNDKNVKLPIVIRVLEWLGSMSFWLYLYHWPIKIIVPHIIGEKLPINTTSAICIAASVLLAIASKLMSSQFKNTHKHRKVIPSLRAAFSVIVVAALILSSISFVRAPKESAIMASLQKTDLPTELVQNKDLIMYSPVISDISKLDRFMDSAAEDRYSKEKGSVAAKDAKSSNVLIIGDSVMLGAKEAVEKVIPGVFVDAKESRGIETASSLLSKYIGDGAEPDLIVISLATNQRQITDEILDDIVSSGGKNRKYILVTGYAGAAQPREEQNSVLAQYANSHDNVFLADWWSIASNDWSLMYSDHIHLNPDGREVYANLLLQSARASGVLE